MSTAVKLGREASAHGTLAASLVSVPCAYSAKFAQKNTVLVEDRQGQDQNFAMQIGTRHEEFTVADSALYHDSFGFWLMSVMGLPTKSSPESGVYKNIFKFADNPESLSIQWQQPRRYTQAYQTLWNVVDQMELKFAVDGDLRYNLSGVGMGESEINQITHSWTDIEPFPAWAGSVTAYGGAFAKLLSGSIKMKRNRKPFFTLNNTQQPYSMSIGSRTVDFDFVLDFSTKDEYNAFKNGTESELDIVWVIADKTIGAISHPTVEFKLGTAAYTVSEIDDATDYPSLKVTGAALYNSTDASLAVVNLTTTVDHTA